MVRDYVLGLYEPAAAAGDRATAGNGEAARELTAWKQHVASSWDGVHIHLEPGSAGVADGAAAGEVRHLRATVQSGAIDQDALTVQILHGPLARDGSFDPARLTVDAMQHVGDGRYEGSFTPTGAGRWGLTVRALPTHPGLSSIFETGLVAVDGR